MRAVSIAGVKEVPISRIEVGPRRREKLGALRQLANSIHTHGLIHPILLRGNVLVAGHRRLEACRLLKWEKIPARQVEQLTEDALRAIELDENTKREALSDYATSKARLAQIRQAEADLKAKVKTELIEHPVQKNQKRGRPKGPRSSAVSREAIADETGFSRPEQARIERHVELAERYPFMQRAGWNRTRVLDAGDDLDRIPEGDRSVVAALLDQDAIPPKDVLRYLHNIVDLPAPARRELVKLAQSPDEHLRQVALTRAAEVPPPVDPSLLLLGSAEEVLRKAARVCRTIEFQSRLKALATEATSLLTAFQEANTHARHTLSATTTVGTPSSAA